MDGACELAGGTPWAEPLSTWTSLAFVLAGAAIAVAALRSRRRPPSAPVPDGDAAGRLRVAFGALVALVGAGSVIQHGPSPAWDPVVHDPPLLGSLALVAADAVADLTGRSLRTWWWLAPTLLGVPLAAASPAASTAAQGVAAVVAVGASAARAWLRPAARRRTVSALVLLAVGGGVGTLTRPGWPLCDADATLGVTLQGHAAWHVLAATALWVLAPTLGTRAALTPRGSPDGVVPPRAVPPAARRWDPGRIRRPRRVTPSGRRRSRRSETTMVTIRRGFSSFSADDLDAARAFYGDTLGLPVTALDDGNGLVLHLGGGSDVFVYPKEDHRPAAFTVMHLTVDDVDQAVDELTAKGVTFERYEGFDQDEKGIVRGFMEGGDGAWLTDPAGNIVGLADGEDMARLVEGQA